uniref:Uncharacterized protein n=1 Tax=Solanum tuberosum TaxID=4113 RepID=M1CDZ6_SOLTU
MKAHIISYLLLFLFILSVEARSLPRFSYDELFNSQDKVDVAGGLNYLDRSKGGGRVPTPSPPNSNLRIHWR